jgi:tetratricopeptide (TPR) repeat protein
VLLEQLVVRDPDYAPAWALMAQAYDFVPNFEPAWLSGDFEKLRPSVAASAPRADAAARRAIQLDPNLADGYASLALALEQRGKFAEAEELYMKAVALDSNNPDVLHLYSRLLLSVGRLKDGLAMRQRLLSLDPFVPVYNSATAWALWLNGRDDEAIALAEPLPSFPRGYTLSRILAAKGRYRDAADIIAAIPIGNFLPGTVEDAVRLLRAAPARVASPQSLSRLGLLEFTYLYVGASGRVLDFYEGGVEVGYAVSLMNAFLWHPSYASVRKTERFKAYVRAAGLVAHWRTRGWPDLCKPIGADDFACE